MDKAEAMDKALRLLSRRAHSVRELQTKLYKREMPKYLIAYVLDECKRLNFLNDELFAQDYASEMASRGNGRFKIKAGLFKKGISSDLIDKVLENLDDNELEQAKQALHFKLRTLQREKDIRKKREKAYRFMATRGFPSDIIRRAFDDSEELSGSTYY
jgi:regulatory protein